MKTFEVKNGTTDCGALMFSTEGMYIRAFASGSWETVKEVPGE